MIYGKKMGNCPDGEMEFHIIPTHLPSYDCSTIRIVYKIKEGIQVSLHVKDLAPGMAGKGEFLTCDLSLVEQLAFWIISDEWSDTRK